MASANFDQSPPPKNLPLEQSLLAASMCDAATAAQIFAELSPADFYDGRHQLVAQAIAERVEAGKPTESTFIAEALRAQGLLERAGGVSNLAVILDAPGAWANTSGSCRELKEYAARRKALNIFKSLAQAACDNADPSELLDQAKEKVDSVREYIEAAVEQGPRTAFRLNQVSSLEVRAPAWLIRTLFETDTIVEIFGDPGCGKTFVGVDVANCVAFGKDFHGCPTKRGPVVYIAGEGKNGLMRRFKAWAIRHRVELDQAPLYVSTAPASFCDAASAAEVKKAIEATGEAPALVVVDTLARNFGPGDENSTMDMSAFIASLDAIRTQYECTVLLIHHTGHADKTRSRGAMALKGALDAEYRMWKDTDGTVRLENTKMKDFEPPGPMAFEIRTVELGLDDESGAPITSAILDSTDYAQPASPAKRGKWQKLASDVLARLYQEHRKTLESGGYCPDQARVLEADWRDACLNAGMPRNRYHEVREKFKIEHGYVFTSIP